jgi:hypothetical protein
MRRTAGLLVLAFLFFSIPALAVDVRVMDSAGIEILVKDITIDYGGLLGNDKEVDGVRLTQGDAAVTAKWADIESITVTGRDSAATRMTVEIALKSGRKVTALLVRKGRMKLVGKADLGEYSIDLEKVKKITVVSAAPSKS